MHLHGACDMQKNGRCRDEQKNDHVMTGEARKKGDREGERRGEEKGESSRSSLSLQVFFRYLCSKRLLCR